jgi:hypothetical protein
MAQATQSWPDSGLGFQIKVLKTIRVVPSSLGSINMAMVAVEKSRSHHACMLKARKAQRGRADTEERELERLEYLVLS